MQLERITVITSHVNDWLQHGLTGDSTWWATFTEPKIKPGDRFEIELKYTPPHPIYTATCLSVSRVSQQDCVSAGTLASIVGWHKITYRLDPVPEAADWGDAALLPDGTHDVIAQGERTREEERRMKEVT